MSQKSFISFLLLIVFPSFQQCSEDQPEQVDSSEFGCIPVTENTLPAPDKLWIEANVYRPGSISPFDTEFDDLQFLKEVIGDRRLVVLGEQTHGDGSTFFAKTRLIKFLHEEMGFTIIAFESGLYECHKAWLDINSGTSPIKAAKQAISKVWSHSSEVNPLFDYLGNRSPELELMGIDHQYFGNYHGQLTGDLEPFLKSINSHIVTSDQWSSKKTLIDKLLVNSITPNKMGPELVEVESTLKEILDAVSQVEASSDELLRDAGFWRQVLSSTLTNIRFNSILNTASSEANQLRDDQMAENLDWLLQEFESRKIIVWTASTHGARYISDAIYYDRSEECFNMKFDYHPFGETIFEKYPDETYSIGFTAYEGGFFNYLTFSQDKIMEPYPNSLEEWLGATGENLAFIDFRSSQLPAWFLEPFVARPFGYSDCLNNWPESVDGIFYTRTMSASTYIP